MTLDRDHAAEVIRQDGLALIGAGAVRDRTQYGAALAAGAQFTVWPGFDPATVGPAHLRALRAPLCDIDFVPTGGIQLGNIADYARAGAAAVRVGGALIPKTGWTSAGICTQAQALRAAWNAARAA